MKVKIKDIKANPNNPRVIRDEQFKKLVKSIQEFPEMLSVRKLVCTTDMVVLGGNMRLKALQSAGIKEVDVEIVDWDEQKQKEFIIKDNVSFGEWNHEQLANEWDAIELQDWGLELPVVTELEPSYDELIGEEKNKPAIMKITFESPEQLQKAEIDIQELIDRKYHGAYFSVSAGDF